MKYTDIVEDNLSNVGKKQKAEIANIAQIRKDLQTTKTIVTKKSEDPTEVDTTTVTIADPKTDTKAVEKISADPTVPTTTTITTKEVGGDFDDELDHVLADVDKGSVVPESKVEEAYKKGRPRRKGGGGRRRLYMGEADAADQPEFQGSVGSLSGAKIWMWYKAPPHDPKMIGQEDHGTWATVGKWVPEVPATGGFYTVTDFADGMVPSQDDNIYLTDIGAWNNGTNSWSGTDAGANATFVAVMESRNINEELQALDLANLINGTISVDKHKSKLGEDKDVIVLAMEVKNNDAANDLMTFIERGYTDVIDADSISSENINGDYMVFVEFERKDTFKNVLSEMLDGVEKLTGINDWSFKHYKSNRTLTMEELHEKLPITPDDYDSFLAKEQNIKDQLQQLKINARVPM